MSNSDHQIKILLVDDTEANLVAMRSILVDPDYEVICARSGKEALRLLLKEDVVLIILDVQMPDMDGFELARLVKDRKNLSDIPIIFTSAFFTDEQDIFKGYAMGAFDYLCKPFHAEILLSKVRVFVNLFKKSELIRRNVETRLKDKEVPEISGVRQPSPSPAIMESLIPEYRRIMTAYIRAIRLNQPTPSEGIKALVSRFSQEKFRAREVTKLHLRVLSEITKPLFHDEAQGVSLDARLLLLEVMGNLTDEYLLTR